METTVAESVQRLLEETSWVTARDFGTCDPGPMPWKDVPLTDEELAAAADKARKEKYYAEEQRMEWQRENDRLKMMKGEWTAEMMNLYVQWRAVRWCGFSKGNGLDRKPVFRIDDHNGRIVDDLCMYFTNDVALEQRLLPSLAGNDRRYWKLNKGVLLCGGVGVGKTKLMELFSVNKRQIYEVLKASDLAGLYMRKGEQGGYDMIEQFSGVHKPVQVKHESNLWQEQLGLCIDDLGTEDEKNNFGNRSNVIADILQGRYANSRLVRSMTHMTTNLSMAGIKGKYGERIASRVMEMFNVVELGGTDRRRDTM